MHNVHYPFIHLLTLTVWSLSRKQINQIWSCVDWTVGSAPFSLSAILWYGLILPPKDQRPEQLHWAVKGEIGWNTAYSASVEINVIWKYILTTWFTFHMLQNSSVQTLIMRRPKSDYGIYKYKIYCLHPIMKWILTMFDNKFFRVSIFLGRQP